MKNLILFSFVFLLFSCSSLKPANEKTYWVNSYKVDCVGVAPMKCLLVQRGESVVEGQWQNFYSNIEGFEFEPGFIYKLKVKEEKLENVPADASSVKYTLVKVIEKKQDMKLRLNDIWLVISVGGEEVELVEETGKRKNAQLEIHISEMKVMGNDGCNNFHGSIKSVGEEILEFGPIAGTRMMCIDMTIPDKINTALMQVKKYKIANLKLTLYDEADNELIVFKKVD